jgi:hypothetical protein
MCDVERWIDEKQAFLRPGRGRSFSWWLHGMAWGFEPVVSSPDFNRLDSGNEISENVDSDTARSGEYAALG